MQSRWSDEEAAACVAGYGRDGVSEDIALCVYGTRLLGRVRELVLHGGGNTSVKTRMADVLGHEQEVLCVKGSGWDMAEIEPAGLPAVLLEPLRRSRALDALDDAEMVRFQRGNLLDCHAPNPSVELLLHAYLPHKFVDHTHSTAVLSLVDQPNGEALAREVYDGRMGIVPYIRPGFRLAKGAARIFEDDPGVEGLVLVKHGIFTFGETARQAYERMIEMVTRAEARLARGRPEVFPAASLPAGIADAAEVAPILRGACAIPSPSADGEPTRMVTEFRAGPEILAYVNGADVADYSQRGVVTPDHNIRTKNTPLMVPAPEARRLDDFEREVRQAVAAFVARYDRYFEVNSARSATAKTKLDPMPRVALVPGVGLFGFGRSAKAARIAADLAESTVRVVTDAEAIGRFEALDEAELFEMEYWSLEQAKLGKVEKRELAGHVVVITGGAGAIGRATAEAFAAEGAEVALCDVSEDAAGEAADRIGGLGLRCDVTDRTSVRAAFDEVCQVFGGVDVLVSNAGAAWHGRIGDVPDETLRQSFELNFFAHQSVAQAAVRVMRAQGLGGVLLFNVSKQAVNPGLDFGPYGLPKAATMFLVRQYALDHGADGIRSNGVNADRIRSGLLTGQMIAERSKARGLSEQDYMSGNLLHREVLADDVARAFVALAKARKTTGHCLTVDGGNIAAALR